MLEPVLDRTRVAKSFRLLKIFSYILAGGLGFSFVVALSGPFLIELPDLVWLKRVLGSLSLIGLGAAILSYAILCFRIASLAQDFGKSYLAWLLGCICLGPIGFFIAYARIVIMATRQALD